MNGTIFYNRMLPGYGWPREAQKLLGLKTRMEISFHWTNIFEYNKERVEEMTGEIKAAAKNKETYIYFNNTFGIGAIANARQLQELL